MVLRSGLVHRYSFAGTGTVVMDTKGTAHGTATGNARAFRLRDARSRGWQQLRGDPKQYVDLPDDLLSGSRTRRSSVGELAGATGQIGSGFSISVATSTGRHHEEVTYF